MIIPTINKSPIETYVSLLVTVRQLQQTCRQLKTQFIDVSDQSFVRLWNVVVRYLYLLMAFLDTNRLIIRNQEQMLNEMEMLISYYEKRPGMGVWIVESKMSSEFIGAAGLTYNTNKAEVELGYRLARVQWKKGYATEVSTELLRYAFQDLKVSKVIASTHEENLPSQQVLEKIGMKQVGKGFEFNNSQIYYEIT